MSNSTVQPSYDEMNDLPLCEQVRRAIKEGMDDAHDLWNEEHEHVHERFDVDDIIKLGWSKGIEWWTGSGDNGRVESIRDINTKNSVTSMSGQRMAYESALKVVKTSKQVWIEVKCAFDVVQATVALGTALGVRKGKCPVAPKLRLKSDNGQSMQNVNTKVEYLDFLKMKPLTDFNLVIPQEPFNPAEWWDCLHDDPEAFWYGRAFASTFLNHGGILSEDCMVAVVNPNDLVAQMSKLLSDGPAPKRTVTGITSELAPILSLVADEHVWSQALRRLQKKNEVDKKQLYALKSAASILTENALH